MYKRQANGLHADEIICGNGSEELLDVIARNYARSGDEILISAYGYIQFEMVARRQGAVLIKAPETDFTTDVDAVLRAVTAQTCTTRCQHFAGGAQLWHRVIARSSGLCAG